MLVYTSPGLAEFPVDPSLRCLRLLFPECEHHSTLFSHSGSLSRLIVVRFLSLNVVGIPWLFGISSPIYQCAKGSCLRLHRASFTELLWESSFKVFKFEEVF